jgi:hypothetical protein
VSHSTKELPAHRLKQREMTRVAVEWRFRRAIGRWTRSMFVDWRAGEP